VSAPYPGGGRPFVLGGGAAAQLLTEYAVGAPPLLLVNISTDRAWIGSDSNVGPSNGVPLDPGTALPWTGQGSVWGVADSGAANPITVYITSAIAGWTPSPATIAAETAAQLLASGVPSVLTEQVIYDAIPFGGPAVIDVHGYASLLLELVNPGAAATQQYSFQTAAGDSVGFGDTFGTTPAVVPVIAGRLVLAADGWEVRVTGTNRPPPHGRPTIAGFTSEAWILSFAGTTVAGQTLTWTPTAKSGPAFQGPASAYLTISAAEKGYWIARTNQNDAIIADTGQGHTSANGSLAVAAQVALPANTTQLGFLAETSSAGVIGTAYLIPAY
jgi:hypothetical protein